MTILSNPNCPNKRCEGGVITTDGLHGRLCKKCNPTKPKKMKTFHIYHATTFTPRIVAIPEDQRSYVGSVQAVNFDDAWEKSNNIDGSWNTENPCRSTSIGDVISDGKRHCLVQGQSFERIESEQIGCELHEEEAV